MPPARRRIFRPSPERGSLPSCASTSPLLSVSSFLLTTATPGVPCRARASPSSRKGAPRLELRLSRPPGLQGRGSSSRSPVSCALIFLLCIHTGHHNPVAPPRSPNGPPSLPSCHVRFDFFFSVGFGLLFRFPRQGTRCRLASTLWLWIAISRCLCVATLARHPCVLACRSVGPVLTHSLSLRSRFNIPHFSTAMLGFAGGASNGILLSLGTTAFEYSKISMRAFVSFFWNMSGSTDISSKSRARVRSVASAFSPLS